MEALLVVDAQNEFSAEGRRPVPNHVAALAAIHRRVDQARREGRPIAWVRHHNRPDESPAFQPGSWGAEFSQGLGPAPGVSIEREFVKDVFGAFTCTGLEQWLAAVGAAEVLIVGFYSHMCVSTSAREALVRGLAVAIDPDGTGACELEDPLLGRQTADEVRRFALMHLVNMGVRMASSAPQAVGTAA